ncbi:MAG: hypothetical protein AB7P76_11365 [Candidatus Melainabacteria bacterium]
MNSFYRFFISLLLAFAVFLHGAAFASVCNCLEDMPVKKHACCPDQQEQQKPPCPHHQQDEKLSQASFKNHDCACSIGQAQDQAIEPSIPQTFQEKWVILDVVTLDPVQDLRISSVQKPTWLRRIYYPDKTSLYLETLRLLI